MNEKKKEIFIVCVVLGYYNKILNEHKNIIY